MTKLKREIRHYFRLGWNIILTDIYQGVTQLQISGRRPRDNVRVSLKSSELTYVVRTQPQSLIRSSDTAEIARVGRLLRQSRSLILIPIESPYTCNFILVNKIITYRATSYHAPFPSYCMLSVIFLLSTGGTSLWSWFGVNWTPKLRIWNLTSRNQKHHYNVWREMYLDVLDRLGVDHECDGRIRTDRQTE